MYTVLFIFVVIGEATFSLTTLIVSHFGQEPKKLVIIKHYNKHSSVTNSQRL